MIEILEMRDSEIDDLLTRVNFGHFACSRDDQPYVVPIHFAYAKPDIFIYTTAGLKSQIIASNPKVCLQVEEMLPEGGWRSAVINGEAHEVVDRRERERAVEIVRAVNPTLLPALAIKWSNDWMKKNVEVLYRINILEMTGRFTSEIRIASASARPLFCSTMNN